MTYPRGRIGTAAPSAPGAGRRGSVGVRRTTAVVALAAVLSTAVLRPARSSRPARRRPPAREPRTPRPRARPRAPARPRPRPRCRPEPDQRRRGPGRGDSRAQIAQEQATLDTASEDYDRADRDARRHQGGPRHHDRLAGGISGPSSTAARSVLRKDVHRGLHQRRLVRGGRPSCSPRRPAAPRPATCTSTWGSATSPSEVARVQAGQRELSATRAKLQSEEQSQAITGPGGQPGRPAGQRRRGAVPGHPEPGEGTLAQEIAQQAAAQAAAAAAAAASGHHRRRARQAAAAQASQAAQVASTVSGAVRRPPAPTVRPTRPRRRSAGGGSASGGSTTTAPGPDRWRTERHQCRRARRRARRHELPRRPLRVGRRQRAGRGLLGPHHAGLGQCRRVPAPLGRAAVRRVPAREPHRPQPGDLLFYDLDGTGIDHVVMYVGPTLDGQATAYGSDTIIQAAHTGTVVTFDPLWYYGLVGAARP